MHGLHHFHKRKQAGLTQNPATPLIAWLDRFIIVVAVVSPLFILPQVWAVWASKELDGVSMVTWTGFSVFSIFWLVYGVVHKEKPIIFTSFLSALFNFLVVLGVLIYR